MLNPEMWSAEQPHHCCADPGDDGLVRMEVRVHDGGGGRYLGLRLYGEWAFDSEADIARLHRALRVCMAQTKEESDGDA